MHRVTRTWRRPPFPFQISFDVKKATDKVNINQNRVLRVRGATFVKSPEYLLKLIVVGSDGPIKQSVLSELSHGIFEGDYLATVGTDIHECFREIDGVIVKLVLWVLSSSIEFKQLHREYYQEASMILLTLESTTPDELQHCRDLLQEIHSVQGKIQLTVVSDIRKDIDKKEIQSFAEEVEASQVVFDFNDKETLTGSVDRMVREVLHSDIRNG
ncbi:MAG: hypothetical protein E3J86_09895 [Candidatus Thorarchaeota archaeon]|nr:MAG: hypothetical protein E3J86_09895 [Candidatus Thorarchaeota archaeon]